MPNVTVLPHGRILAAQTGDSLYQLLFREGLSPAAPCGGTGKCGKCIVTVNGLSRKACETQIHGDMTVELPETVDMRILAEGEDRYLAWDPPVPGYAAAIDLGTTTLCCYLLDKTGGHEMVSRSAANPQRAAGADVVSRIRAAAQGHLEELTLLLRDAVNTLLLECCREAEVKPREIRLISVVGNPAMQQFFLGLAVDNLIQLPYLPVLTRAELIDGRDYLPEFSDALIMVVPDISAYVGADTLGCILACGMQEMKQTVLLVDIGTNGEMVLCHRGRMLACAAAAGPALEGADISCGITARPGAVDRVWVNNGVLCSHVIGEGTPLGICGSGLIDAAAAALELGLVNSRGKLMTDQLEIAGGVRLNQEDIRALQLAKGAIRAGIELLCDRMGISVNEIDEVLLAGAFGSYLNPRSACRIGLLPRMPEGKIRPAGNAAGSGAKLLCRSRDAYRSLDTLASGVEPLDLGAQKDFPRAFARGMRFPDPKDLEESE